MKMKKRSKAQRRDLLAEIFCPTKTSEVTSTGIECLALVKEDSEAVG